MKKHLFKTMAYVVLSAAMLLTVACRDDEDGPIDNPTEHPSLKQGNEQRPNWEEQEPNYLQYEHTMGVDIMLQDILLPYASEDDLMCATIRGEVRAVATPDSTDHQFDFPMVIAGHSGDENVSLHYYCNKLKRIFSITDWMPFSPSAAPTLEGTSYTPPFITDEK